MSDPLYRKDVLRLAADAHGAGRIAGPHQTGLARNPACGDAVKVDLVLDDAGHITAMAHETKACVLTQASASILGERLKGFSREQVQGLRDEVTAMLANPTALPMPPFDVYGVFDGLVGYKGRHTCVLLPIDAALAAFDASEAAEKGAKGT